MISKNICGGRAFRIVVGITVMMLLLIGGADAATLRLDYSGVDYASRYIEVAA